MLIHIYEILKTNDICFILLLQDERMFVASGTNKQMRKELLLQETDVSTGH